MSTLDLMNKITEKPYAIDRIITAMQKRPHNDAGESMHSNEVHTLKMIAENGGSARQSPVSRCCAQRALPRLWLISWFGAVWCVGSGRTAISGATCWHLPNEDRRYIGPIWTMMKRIPVMPHNALGMSEEELVDLNDKPDRIIEFYSTHYLDHGCPIDSDEV